MKFSINPVPAALAAALVLSACATNPAAQKAANPNIDYFVPKEGSFLFVDSLVIPKTAPHPEAAHKFLAYLAEPKVAADITDKVGYANPIVASKALVRPELIDSPLGFPPTDLIERLVYQADIGADERQWDRIWAEVKL